MTEEHAAPKNGHAGVLAWRTVYSVGLVVLGALSLMVLNTVKETEKGVSDLKAAFAGANATITFHSNRINRLEDQVFTGRKAP